MSVARLKEIREIEKQSDLIIKEAEEKAEAILKDARLSADELLKKARIDGEEEAENIRRKKEEETEKEITTLEKKASADKERVRKTKKEKQNDATDLVLKHILE
ncbi:MAG: hypothetical protein ACXAD7_06805 [Candidatus Kariarchaeaceae archaeon]|jgi:vacuolar-type H+-ATPase subunit H